MNKNKVKTAVNVAAVILVPLINERHKLKEQREVQQLTGLSVKAYDVTKDKTVTAARKTKGATTTIKRGAVKTSSFIADKYKDEKKALHYKKKMKPFVQQAKEEKKQKKVEQKQINTLGQTLSQSIESRRRDEEKNEKAREKRLIKEMKLAEKGNFHAAQTVTSKQDKKVKKEIDQLDKKLNKSIEERHKAELQLKEENEKLRIKALKKYKNYKVKTPKQNRSLFGLKKHQLTEPHKPNNYHNAQMPNDEDFSNAQLFERHRKQMAEKIGRR
ncbi:hypothetical protein QA541_02430 [Macrococcus psychrotolerans]|uniref:Uncharacterized protein n=1 Tax=Macrococcus psychrotolerans TaxID=3039389 RepID=A0AAU6RAP7_9STAP